MTFIFTRGPLGRGFAAVLLALALAGPSGCAQMRQDFDRALAEFDGEDSGSTYAEARRLDAAGRDAEAVPLYRRAAEAGNAEAAYELGEAYWLGEGVGRDLATAADWFNRSAEGGSPRGQYLLGRAHAEGRGVPQDDARAARYFARAAAQGHAPAQYELGRAFANGTGVPKDVLWAGRWYGKAARQGNVDAQFAYGALLAAGQGLPRDPELGYAYLTRAAANGSSEAAKLLPTLRGRMSPDQRRAAERLTAGIKGAPETAFADRPTVRYVQAALDRLGIDAGPVDGLMGSRTRAGLRAFQEAHGLAADGDLTPALLQRILDETRARG